jgi:hypothetical protein
VIRKVLENDAAVPTPSCEADVKLPANVVTTDAGEIILIRLPSATTIFPALFTTMSDGSEKVAELAPPSKCGKELPVPARAETSPVGEILRMRSATYTTPEESMVIPQAKKLALVPVPATQGCVPLPANVVVTPAAEMILMRKMSVQ